jgi:hypothetical protein
VSKHVAPASSSQSIAMVPLWRSQESGARTTLRMPFHCLAPLAVPVGRTSCRCPKAWLGPCWFRRQRHRRALQFCPTRLRPENRDAALLPTLTAHEDALILRTHSGPRNALEAKRCRRGTSLGAVLLRAKHPMALQPDHRKSPPEAEPRSRNGSAEFCGSPRSHTFGYRGATGCVS